MNERGQYGKNDPSIGAVPLYGGSVFSHAPWGGAPDPTVYGWPYRGPRAFDGHEAPTFGREGSWPPRREAPRDRGGLAVGSAMNTRGVYGRASVGNVLYHSVGDIETAVKQLSLDYDAAYADIGHKAGYLSNVPGQTYASQAELSAGGPRAAQLYAWWKATVKPLFDKFTEFKHEMLGGDRTFADSYIAYGNRFGVTSWDNEIKVWYDRLVDLRADAKRQGLSLTSPPPKELGTTLIEDVKKAGEKAGEKVGEVWDLAKYAVYGALGIGAIIALSSVVSNLKSGKDPAANYMEILRGRRAASRFALA